MSVRQTANPSSRTVSLPNQTLLSETVGRDACGRISSLFGQAVEYDGFGFLRKAMGEEMEYLPGGAISKRKIGQTNRTYTYDSESGLYFLGFRLYDPRIGRFLSPDSPWNADFSSPGGLDLCAYCMNDPIGRADPGGNSPEWLNWLVGGALIFGAIVLTVATAGLGTALASTVGGGFCASVLSGAIIGGVVGAVSGAMISAGTELIANGFENISWSTVGRGAVSGIITGAIAGGIFGGIGYAFKSSAVARAASQLDAAEYDLIHSMGSLRSITGLCKSPFASANINRAILTAMTNYNAAYTGFIMAKSTYYALHGMVETAYFIGQNWMADWLGNYL